MYNSSTYSVISYCIGVWGGVSQSTSRCNVHNRIQKRKIKKNAKVFFFKIVVVASRKRES